MILIGTSGWQYDWWRGAFYPADVPKSRWLEHFATRFPTVELNNSFYRLPSERAFDGWRERTPDGFVMAVKASRYLTHIKRLRDPKEPVDLFWSRAKHLRSRLGPVLFQLPPRFAVDLERLEAVLAVLPDGMRPAFEFRDRSWETDAVYARLDSAGAAFVLADRAGGPVPDVVTGGWTYVRFHQGGEHAPGYGAAALRRWADRLASMPARDAFVYFNNDQGGAAIRDAATLTEMLQERGARVRGGHERGGDARVGSGAGDEDPGRTRR
jgi:uncharacterized protein YecE (DUF72 family)